MKTSKKQRAEWHRLLQGVVGRAGMVSLYIREDRGQSRLAVLELLEVSRGKLDAVIAEYRKEMERDGEAGIDTRGGRGGALKDHEDAG